MAGFESDRHAMRLDDAVTVAGRAPYDPPGSCGRIGSTMDRWIGRRKFLKLLLAIGRGRCSLMNRLA